MSRAKDLVEMELEETRQRHSRELRHAIGLLAGEHVGRLFLGWLIYEIGGHDGDVVNLAIKDGECASLHAFYQAGRRSIATQVNDLVGSISDEEADRIRKEFRARRRAVGALEDELKTAGDIK